MSADKRKSPRTPGYSRAAIARIGANATPVMCTVVDISDGGIGLTFVNIAGVPDTFQLEIKGDPTIRCCKVAWRQEPHRLGAAFAEPADAAADAKPGDAEAAESGEAAFVDAPAEVAARTPVA